MNMSWRPSGRRMVVVLAVAAAAVTAQAVPANVVDEAHRAVQLALRQHVGGPVDVTFTSDRENPFSMTETRVTGRGYYIAPRSSVRLYFDYSVKVRGSTGDSRDVVITQDKGDRITHGGITRSRDPIGDPNFRGSAVRIRQPSAGETVDGPRISFSGECESGDVRIEVFSMDGSLIASQQVRSRDGRWEWTRILNGGDYRLVVTSVAGRRADQIRFRVRGLDRGRDRGRDRIFSVRINRPRDGQTFDATRVEINGDAEGSDVHLQVFDGSRRVADVNLSARDRHWSTSLTLRPGEYRVLVELKNGRAHDEVRFRIRDRRDDRRNRG